MKISEMITDKYKLRIPPTVYYDLLADVQEVEEEQGPKFIAKSDGTIEQIKNCNDCLFKKEWEKIGKLLSVILEKQTEQEPKTGHCRDCKWWKDSDGAYRRGVRAESHCPINRKEVYEGNGYCFLYEPQESEDKE